VLESAASSMLLLFPPLFHWFSLFCLSSSVLSVAELSSNSYHNLRRQPHPSKHIDNSSTQQVSLLLLIFLVQTLLSFARQHYHRSRSSSCKCELLSCLSGCLISLPLLLCPSHSPTISHYQFRLPNQYLLSLQWAD